MPSATAGATLGSEDRAVDRTRGRRGRLRPPSGATGNDHGTRKGPVSTMARVEVLGDRLSVQLQGMDRLWSLKSRLEIPLAHVTGAEAAPDVARAGKGWRGPGTHVPGAVTAGTFHDQGDRVFWDVRDAAKTVAIGLTDERYDRLVVEVADPARTVAAIRQALGNG